MRRHDVKKIAQRIHCKKRLTERFGITATTAMLGQIVKVVQSGQAKLIEHQTNRLSKWELMFNDKLMHVVYDNRSKEICTVLYPEIQSNKGENHEPK